MTDAKSLIVRDTLLIVPNTLTDTCSGQDYGPDPHVPVGVVLLHTHH